jgi:predicted nucleic-acid-binding Zn-ribbon protein
MHSVVIRTGGKPSKINDIQNMWNTFLYTFMIWCKYIYICLHTVYI